MRRTAGLGLADVSAAAVCETVSIIWIFRCLPTTQMRHAKEEDRLAG